MSHKITTATKQLSFLTGGKAIFTIENEKTATRITYRVEKVSDTTFNVMVYTRGENHLKSSYTNVGRIVDGVFVGMPTEIDFVANLKAQAKNAWIKSFAESIERQIAKGRNLSTKQASVLSKSLKEHHISVPSAMSTEDVRFKSFKWLWNRINSGNELPQGVNFYHEGRCCQCAKPLTVPASIMTGMGPDCAKASGIGALWKSLNKSFPVKA